MKKLAVVVTLSLAVLGPASHATAQVSLNLRGPDALEKVTKAVIASCQATGGLTPGSIVFIGGGTGAAENAMKGPTPTQQIGPMTRELNGRVPGDECGFSNPPTSTIPQADQELLVALDAVVVVAANQPDLDSVEAFPAIADCSDSIGDGDPPAKIIHVPGCGADLNTGCDAADDYTFASWKDVLAMVYGGQNNKTANGPLLVSGTHNPGRVDCASVVRQELVNHWGNLFSDVAGTSCRTPSCTRLQHAFRRDDQSRVTELFLTLVGMHNIAPSTTTCLANLGPSVDSAATANPFCNAGEQRMNAGDADYLDLDPIRRPAHKVAGFPGVGLESVAEAYTQDGGLPANSDAQCTLQPGLQDHSLSNNRGALPDPGAPAGGLAADLQARHCLGLVLPIVLPTNFTTPQMAYWGDAAGKPVRCTPGVFVPKIVVGACPTCICPDGSPQPCDVPVVSDVAGVVLSYSCEARPSPAPPPKPPFPTIRDTRVFNLNVVTPGPPPGGGAVVRDNYFNPNLQAGAPGCPAGLSASRQARAVKAFYRLHAQRATDLSGSIPTRGTASIDGNVCQGLTSPDDQIGCLVKASACSIGFGGLAAIDPNVADNFAFRIETLAPSTRNINAQVTLDRPAYSAARTLWLNAIKGITNVVGNEGILVSPNPGCFRDNAAVDAAVLAQGFLAVPPGVPRLNSCPSPFPPAP